MKYLLVAVSLAAALLLLGLPSPATQRVNAAAPDAGHLLVAGSSTMVPLISAMARRFQELHPRVRIEVRAGGSTRGLADVREGLVDIGMVAYALNPNERDVQGLPIARDGVALVVHQDNPVRSLTHAQVAAVFTGSVLNWKALGGKDQPILSIGTDPRRGSLDFFARHFQIPVEQMRPQRTEADTAVRLQLLREHPGAITYLPVGEVERRVRAGAPLRALPEEGVPSTSDNIGRGDYPLARPLTLVTRAGAGMLARAFVAFCASSEVTDLILAHDFVPYLD